MGENRRADRVVTRRSFLRLLGATVPAAYSLSATTPLAASPSTVSQLVIAGGGGALTDAYRKAYYEPYTAKTGIKIVEATNDAAKLKAMVQSGVVEWDLAQIDAAIAASAGHGGLLEPLDYSIINKGHLLSGSAKEFYIPIDYAAYVIAWNTKKYTTATAPKTWADYINVSAFKGTRSFWRQPSQTLEVVLLGDGVPPDKLYPLDVHRALTALTKIKSQVRFWTGGAQSAQWLLSGEVDLGTSWNGRLQGPKIQGLPVDFTFNQALLVADAWVVPKGARNKRASMEFIAFAMQAKRQAAEAEAIPYGPDNLDAFSLIDSAHKALLPNAPGHHYARVQDFDWWAVNQTSVLKVWNDWLQS